MLTPTKYWALFKLRDNRWRSRGDMGRMRLAQKVKAITGGTVVGGAVIGALAMMMAAGTWPLNLPPAPKGLPVLSNNASAGKERSSSPTMTAPERPPCNWSVI